MNHIVCVWKGKKIASVIFSSLAQSTAHVPFIVFPLAITIIPFHHRIYFKRTHKDIQIVFHTMCVNSAHLIIRGPSQSRVRSLLM